MIPETKFKAGGQRWRISSEDGGVLLESISLVPKKQKKNKEPEYEEKFTRYLKAGAVDSLISYVAQITSIDFDTVFKEYKESREAKNES